MTTPQKSYPLNRTLDQAKIDGTAPWNDLHLDLHEVKVYHTKWPVTPGHLLFVPERDAPDLITQCFHHAYFMGEAMVKQGECDGFNIGMHIGVSAGQTQMYPHVHLIPRRTGDCPDPTGGVRGVIPGQANYKKPEYQDPMDK